jgi:hypothetical protein
MSERKYFNRWVTPLGILVSCVTILAAVFGGCDYLGAKVDARAQEAVRNANYLPTDKFDTFTKSYWEQRHEDIQFHEDVRVFMAVTTNALQQLEFTTVRTAK